MRSNRTARDLFGWIVLGWALVLLTAASVLHTANASARQSDNEKSVHDARSELSAAAKTLSSLQGELQRVEEKSANLAAQLRVAERGLRRSERVKQRLTKRVTALDFRALLRDIRDTPTPAGSSYDGLPPGVDPWGNESDYYDPCADFGDCNYEDEYDYEY